MSADIVSEIVGEYLVERIDKARHVSDFAEPVKGHPAWEDDIDQHERLGGGVVEEDVAGDVIDSFVAELKRLIGSVELVLVLKGLGRERPRRVSRYFELGKGVRMCDDGRVWVGGSDDGGTANMVCEWL